MWNNETLRVSRARLIQLQVELAQLVLSIAPTLALSMTELSYVQPTRSARHPRLAQKTSDACARKVSRKQCTQKAVLLRQIIHTALRFATITALTEANVNGNQVYEILFSHTENYYNLLFLFRNEKTTLRVLDQLLR